MPGYDRTVPPGLCPFLRALKLQNSSYLRAIQPRVYPISIALTCCPNPPRLYNRPRRRLRIGADCKVGHRIEGRGKSKRREFCSYHWETAENEDDDEDDWGRKKGGGNFAGTIGKGPRIEGRRRENPPFFGPKPSKTENIPSSSLSARSRVFMGRTTGATS